MTTPVDHIVLVDNGSSHLRELLDLCGPERTTVVAAPKLQPDSLPPGALVVLSGSHDHAVRSGQTFYGRELALLDAGTHPVIGICAGFELIAHHAGAKLLKLPQPEKAVIEVFPTPEGENWFPAHHIPVAEGHRWVVRDVPPGYLALARSTDGIEAIGNLTSRVIGFQFHPEHAVSRTNGGAVFMAVLDRLSRP